SAFEGVCLQAATSKRSEAKTLTLEPPAASNGEVEGPHDDAPRRRGRTISQRPRRQPRSASRPPPTIVRGHRRASNKPATSATEDAGAKDGYQAHPVSCRKHVSRSAIHDRLALPYQVRPEPICLWVWQQRVESIVRD